MEAVDIISELVNCRSFLKSWAVDGDHEFCRFQHLSRPRDRRAGRCAMVTPAAAKAMMQAKMADVAIPGDMSTMVGRHALCPESRLRSLRQVSADGYACRRVSRASRVGVATMSLRSSELCAAE